jgi:hypothetical protein
VFWSKTRATQTISTVTAMVRRARIYPEGYR